MTKLQLDEAKRLAEELLGNGLKVGENDYLIASATEAQLSAALLHQSKENERLREFIKELLNECENHTRESHGDYGCSCAGDSYEMNQVLKKYSNLMEGKDE